MTRHGFVDVTHDGPVSTVTLDRPDKLNALSAEVLGDLEAAIAEVGGRPETRAVILTGAGKAFVAGADIAGMLDMDLARAQAFGERGHAVFEALELVPCPVIAAVNGFALGGGCELALACDFIYASEKAKFGLPEVGLGVIPGFGGTQRLPRRVGYGMARELVYSGRMIDAAEALRIGLANRVCAPEALLGAARETALSIAEKGPLAVATAKRVMREGSGIPLPHANRIEIAAFADLFETEERREGMTAFIEKRPAKF